MAISRRAFGQGVLAGGLLTLVAACGGTSQRAKSGGTTPASTATPSSATPSSAAPTTAAPPTTLGVPPAPAPLVTWKPVIADRRGDQLTANGARLVLGGVVVMGVPAKNQFTADFATGTGVFTAEEGQYPNRELICATVKAWGGNAIRLRYSSTDIAAEHFGWTAAKYLQCVKDWVTAAKAHGLYTVLSDWSAYESPPAGKVKAAWPSWVPTNVFPVWQKIAELLKLADGTHDPYVIWEPLNEPADVPWATWLTAFQSIVSLFRETIGYTGVLICDGLMGSTAWDASAFDSLTAYDAGQKGMDGVSQVAFTNHDYALTSKPSTFRSANWLSETLAKVVRPGVVPARLSSPTANQYCRFETEFGNDVDGRGGNAQWSSEAAAFFAKLPRYLPGYSGGFAYVWGPWSDANAIVAKDNTTPTSPWGTTVKRFLATTGATPVPPAS